MAYTMTTFEYVSNQLREMSCNGMSTGELKTLGKQFGSYVCDLQNGTAGLHLDARARAHEIEVLREWCVAVSVLLSERQAQLELEDGFAAGALARRKIEHDRLVREREAEAERLARQQSHDRLVRERKAEAERLAQRESDERLARALAQQELDDRRFARSLAQRESMDEGFARASAQRESDVRLARELAQRESEDERMARALAQQESEDELLAYELSRTSVM